jgi:hypothetical protein
MKNKTLKVGSKVRISEEKDVWIVDKLGAGFAEVIKENKNHVAVRVVKVSKLTVV